MSTAHQSKACCSVPPVVSKGYSAKGEYTTVAGLKTYATGVSQSPAPTKAILVVYDIFGFKPQTLQGADILASADGDASHKYAVFMPDFFEGKPVALEDFPPDTEEKKATVGKFFETTAAPPKTLERIPKIVEELSAKHPHIQSWGIVGFCWGGKISVLSAQKSSLFKAAAACHPAMVDPKDAEGVSVPFAMLPSGDEDKDAVQKWQQAVKTEHEVEWFPDQVHGWMAARGDLEDAKVKKEYERGYSILLQFFHKHM